MDVLTTIGDGGGELVDVGGYVAVDALLLDSGNPTLAVQELGGTGRVHDWSISRRIRDTIGVPIQTRPIATTPPRRK